MRAPRPRRASSAPRRSTVGEESRPEPDPRSYEEKLIAALRGPLPDRRVLAARILGRLRSRPAIPTLEAIALEREDPYLSAEAARALALIDPELPVVADLARAGPALARDAVEPVCGRCHGEPSPQRASLRREKPREG